MTAPWVVGGTQCASRRTQIPFNLSRLGRGGFPSREGKMPSPLLFAKMPYCREK